MFAYDRGQRAMVGGGGTTTDATIVDVNAPRTCGDDDVVEYDNDADVTLRLDGAAFRVGGVACGMEGGIDVDDVGGSDLDGIRLYSSPAGGFGVSNFDFSLSRGEVLAVVGPVGSGKSTLLNGILGEATSVGTGGGGGGGVSIRGRVSYVPQAPFVLNTSLRDNVLFGRGYDPVWYDAVLDACCLRPDLDQLGEAGDMTEIGKRGVTLSGGQKQRVCLARAAYARSDLVVLDDPRFSPKMAGGTNRALGFNGGTGVIRHDCVPQRFSQIGTRAHCYPYPLECELYDNVELFGRYI